LTSEGILIKISKKHYDLKFLAEQFFFKLLSFLNGLSQRYQIGLKFNLIYHSFRKYKEGKFSSMKHHKELENNWFFDKSFDEKLVHSPKINLKYQKKHLNSSFPENYFKILFI